MSNSQEVQRNLGQGLIIIGMCIVTIVRTGKLNKSHFTLILQMVLIVVKVTGLITSNKVTSPENLRKRESFWQHELDTFQPNSSNEREVTLC